MCARNGACKQTRNTNRVHEFSDAGRDVVVALAPVDGRAASLEGFPHDPAAFPPAPSDVRDAPVLGASGGHYSPRTMGTLARWTRARAKYIAQFRPLREGNGKLHVSLLAVTVPRERRASWRLTHARRRRSIHTRQLNLPRAAPRCNETPRSLALHRHRVGG